jgi:hypothetical protein
VARDRLQHLDGDHGQVGLIVDPVQQLPHLRLGQEEAHVLVPVAMHGHAHAVQEGAERDDDLGVLLVEAVVAHHARLDAVLRELSQELERDVGDDLDVDPGVVVDLHARDGVHVRRVPPRLQLEVAVDAVEQLPQLAVAADGQRDSHPLDRLGRSEARFALGLLRDRVVDSLFGLVVDCHGPQFRSMAYFTCG